MEVFYNDHWGTAAGLCAGVLEFTGFYDENLGTSSRFLFFDVDHGDIYIYGIYGHIKAVFFMR